MKYTIKRSSRKTLAISIVDGKVIVRAPYHVPMTLIESFVEEKKTWIESKLNSYRPVSFNMDQSSLRLFGEIYPLEFKVASKFNVKIDSSIVITHTKNMSEDKIIAKIEDYFKKILYKYIDDKVSYYADKLGIEKPPFKIRRYKRLHGRCNNRGELAFNLYLYHDRLDFIDYVVLHECAHILEFNHSKAFYAIIEKHMPNYKEIIALNKI